MIKKCIADDLIEEAKRAQERVSSAMQKLTSALDKTVKIKVVPRPEIPKKYTNGFAD